MKTIIAQYKRNDFSVVQKITLSRAYPTILLFPFSFRKPGDHAGCAVAEAADAGPAGQADEVPPPGGVFGVCGSLSFVQGGLCSHSVISCVHLNS